MYSFRISKFSPAQAAQDRRSDWTSVSDVGRRFAGKTLTREAYEDVEGRYLEAVRLMLLEARVTKMLVSDVFPAPIGSAASEWIKEGTTVDLEGVLAVCRAELREELSCHLGSERGFCIDFGFDFYLYVTTPTPSCNSVQRISELGLFVEEGVPSPYFNP